MKTFSGRSCERFQFMVRGVENKMYSVTLFPKETCQCPSTNTLSYNCSKNVLKQKLIIMKGKWGIKTDRKIRKKWDKKTPKPSDYETVIPAPDSRLAHEQSKPVLSNTSISQPLSSEVIKESIKLRNLVLRNGLSLETNQTIYVLLVHQTYILKYHR